MTVINKTPHPVNLLGNDGEIVKILPACEKGDLIRLKQETVPAGKIDGIPLTRTIFGEPEGLPSFANDVYYVVSQLVKNALPERQDLLVPAEVVRGADGQILGCRSLGL